MKRGLLVIALILASGMTITGYLYVRIAYRGVSSVWEEWKRSWSLPTGDLRAQRYESLEKRVLPSIQEELVRQKLDGWLFFERQGENRSLRELLLLPGEDPLRNDLAVSSVRSDFSHAWAYYIPAHRMAGKIVHPIDAGLLDGIPGEECLYLTLPEWDRCRVKILGSAIRIAVNPSPPVTDHGEIAGTTGGGPLLSGKWPEMVSSGHLTQLFLAKISGMQLSRHRQAASRLSELAHTSFSEIRAQWEAGHPYTIGQWKQYLSRQMERLALRTAFPPLVSSGRETAIPYYSPASLNQKRILPGDLVQLEIAACMDEPDSVYAKTAWVGYMGREIPAHITGAFQACVGARKAAIRRLQAELRKGGTLTGSEIDQEIRRNLLLQGYTDVLPHASGHSLGRFLFGPGANLESRMEADRRPLIAGTAFTLEPAVYLSDFGVRTTVNLYLREEAVEITTLPEQEEVVPILR